MTSFFALTTRGLESIVQTELTTIDNVQLRSIAYRRVHGEMDKQFHLLKTVRTADDIFLVVADWDNIQHTREMLSDFTRLSATLDLKRVLHDIRTVRPVPKLVTFSVTVNFVGKRNYNYNEVKVAVAKGILRRLPQWSYTEDDGEAMLNVRIFIEHDIAVVGVRLAASPLHRRDYKQNSLTGSLKSPVAAAMIQLANSKKGQVILDPFCGSGTILIEAMQQGFTALGGDIDWQSVQTSRDNAELAGENIVLSKWDTQQLPFRNKSIHTIVSNLPWGRQIKVDTALQSFYKQAYSEMKRVLASDGKIVLLTTLPDLIPDTPSESFEVSVHGQNPQMMVF